MLLERLGRSLHALELPVQQRHEILVDTAQRVWRRAPRAALPSGADGARSLAAFIPEAYEASRAPVHGARRRARPGVCRGA